MWFLWLLLVLARRQLSVFVVNAFGCGYFLGRHRASWLSFPWRSCSSSSSSRWGYATVLRMLRGHWLLTISQWWDFLRRLQRSHRLEPCLELDSAFATASQGSCDPPTQNPFHPGHLPTVGWAYIIICCFDRLYRFFLGLRDSLLLFLVPTALYRLLVRGALYASTRPLLGQRHSASSWQLLFRSRRSVVYLWPFAVEKMRKMAICTPWYAFQYVQR